MTDKATRIIADAMRSTGCYEHVNIEDHAQIIRAALAAARIELIELPEPEVTHGSYFWGLDVRAIPGSGKVRVWVDDHRHTANEARALAAALLAAAHTAETQP